MARLIYIFAFVFSFTFLSPNFALAQNRDATVFEFGDQFGADFQFSDIGGSTAGGLSAVGNGMARLVQIAPGGGSV